MGFRVTKPEDLKNLKLPEELREQLAAELAPRGLPGPRGPWRLTADAPQTEYACLRDIYLALAANPPNLNHALELIKARLKDLSQ